VQNCRLSAAAAHRVCDRYLRHHSRARSELHRPGHADRQGLHGDVFCHGRGRARSDHQTPHEGRKVSKAQGVKMGPQPKLNEKQKAEARKRLAAGEIPNDLALCMALAGHRSRGCASSALHGVRSQTLPFFTINQCRPINLQFLTTCSYHPKCRGSAR
jgi:hypothetical protein